MKCASTESIAKWRRGKGVASVVFRSEIAIGIIRLDAASRNFFWRAAIALTTRPGNRAMLFQKNGEKYQ